MSRLNILQSEYFKDIPIVTFFDDDLGLMTATAVGPLVRDNPLNKLPLG